MRLDGFHEGYDEDQHGEQRSEIFDYLGHRHPVIPAVRVRDPEDGFRAVFFKIADLQHRVDNGKNAAEHGGNDGEQGGFFVFHHQDRRRDEKS